MKIVPQSVVLEAHTLNPAQLIERAGRTCYKSEDKITEGSAGRFIEILMDKHHESVIEHATATFRIVCDRGVTHELVRHRLCSFSQESTRYANYSKDKFGNEITVIEPPGLRGTDGQCNAAWWHWRGACETAEHAYLCMLGAGQAPQIARSVLPTCLKTEIVVTANFREWKHIIALRTGAAAHPQIREVALMVQKELQVICPEVFGALIDSPNTSEPL